MQISSQPNSGGATKYIRRSRLKGRNWQEGKEYSRLTGELGRGLDLELLRPSFAVLVWTFAVAVLAVVSHPVLMSVSFSVC